jgi:type I restriction enzyme, S subunit
MSDLGSNWKSRPLGELATTTSGGTPSRTRKDYYGGTIPWVKSGELNDDYIFQTEEHITEAGLKNSSAKLFPSGTVLIALYGATVGKTSILRTEASTNQAVCGITPGPDLDADFLRYYLISLRRELLSHRYGGAQPNISQQIVRNQKIAYPTLPEQKKIAHILSTVQRAIEAQERIIQTTTELKKALMHKLFTEGLRDEPQKQTEIGPVPESWEVVRLSEVCGFQSGGTPSKQNAEFWQGTIPWVSPKDMKRPRLDDVTDHISQEALDSGSKLAPAGSVFVVVRGMILAKTVPVALAEVPMAINQDMKAIVPGPKLRSDFLLYALETFRDNLFKKVGRSGHGTATLMGHEVAAFKIPLPDLQTQIEIASAIQNLERKKELHEEKRKQLQDLFRTLLHELMTAKTRVHSLCLTA